MATFRLSQYVHSHVVEAHVTALYHPFGHEVAFVPERVVAELRSGAFDKIPPEVLNDLLRRNFVVPEEWDQHVLDKFAEKPLAGFFSLWLVVAQTCNIGCTYCVVEADTQTRNLPELPELAKVHKGLMTEEVAIRALEVFRESLDRHRQPFAKLTLYGGEPLINRKLLKTVVPLARALRWQGQQQPLEILCFTNGHVYDDELTQVFLDHDVTVGISLDGTKEINDAARVTHDGAGTYDRTVSSYWKYKEAGLRVGLSCTIGNHNKGQLLHVVRHMVEDLNAPSIQFQTPIQVMDGSPNYIDMHEVARESLNAFEFAQKAGVEEGLALRRLTSFAAGRFHYRDCAAVGGELAVSPDGTTGPCHNATIGGESYFSGNVLQPGFNPEHLPNFIEWHARMPINMPGCHGCSFIGLCGGGCPYNALVAKGSIWEKDPQQCGYMEELVNWLLEDIWSKYSGHPKPHSAPPKRSPTITSARDGVPITFHRTRPALGH